jgi:hypothetical protein
MITYAMLRNLDLGPIMRLAQSWDRLGQHSDILEDDFEQQVLGRLVRSGWSGPASTSAIGELDRQDDLLEAPWLLARGIEMTMAEIGHRVGHLQRCLYAVVDEAHRLGFTVTAAGEVVGRTSDVNPMLVSDPIAASAEAARAGRLGTEVADLLASTARVDEEATRVLSELVPFSWGEIDSSGWYESNSGLRAAAAWLGIMPESIPADGQPGAARAWWSSLSPRRQALYVEAYPDRVGTLDGLPSTTRDQANRLELRMAEHYAWSAFDDKGAERVHRLMTHLERNEYRGADQAPLFLLEIDNERYRGRGVVAVGNPDTATHQAVLVPGVNTNLDRMTGEIDRATNLWSAAAALDPGPPEAVSVIAWLDYEPPIASDRALSAKSAEDGAPTLTRFVDTMRQTTPDSHITMVGHSYGSLVVGLASSEGGLRADDIVTAGSPGMGVDDVSDLRIDPRHVWAGAAADDDISGWAGNFAHDLEPHEREFGANRYVVDTSGHSAYWQPDSLSLTNQALVVVGRYGDVALEHGGPPA